MAKLPKPVVSSALVVAAFDGQSPRFLCKDARRGHWVTTDDLGRAQRFDHEAAARGAIAAYAPIARQYGGGDWRLWRMTSRTTFAAV